MGAVVSIICVKFVVWECVKSLKRQHHSVGTCLWHVSNALIHCRLHRNMPKACPYAMALSFFWGWLVVEVEGGVFVAG